MPRIRRLLTRRLLAVPLPAALALAALLAGAAPALAAAEDDAGAPLLSTVRGRVVDPDGRPVSGVEVWPSGGYSREPAAVTGADGSFSLADLPAGSQLFLVLCRPGYAEQTLTVAAPAAAPFVAVMAPAARISGQVVDAEGRPVAGAEVTHDRPREPGSRTDLWSGVISCGFGSAFSLPRTTSCERTGSSTRTDAEGRFAFAPVRPERYRVAVWAEGFAPAEQGDVVAEAGREAAVVLALRRDPAARRPEGWPQFSEPEPASPPEIEVRGRTVDPRGRPVGGARVEARPGSSRVEPYAEARSGSDGAFALRLPPGFYDLFAAAGRLAGIRGNVQVPREGLADAAEVEVRLSEGGSIAGRVAGIEPGERGAVEVSAFRHQAGAPEGDETPSQLPPVRLGAGGRYRFPHVPPGHWSVSASLPAQTRFAGAEAEVAPGQDAVADLAFRPARPLSGRVIDETGAPAGRASVRLLRQDEEGQVLDPPVAADGSFRTRLEDGRYRLEVRREDYYLVGPGEVAVDGAPVEGLEVRIAHGGVIAGRRVAAHEHAFGGQVTAEGPGGKVEVEPGPDGRYRLAGLAPGEWTVSSSTREGGRQGRSLTVRLTVPPPSPDKPPAELRQDFDLGPGDLELTVVVRESRTRPGLRQLELRALDTSAGERVLSDLTPDEYVSFDRLLPGRYRLRVSRLTPPGGNLVPIYEQEIEIRQSRKVEIGPQAAPAAP